VWQSARRYPDKNLAHKYKGEFRWALLKNPQDLTAPQAETLAGSRKTGGVLWRTYLAVMTLGRDSRPARAVPGGPNAGSQHSTHSTPPSTAGSPPTADDDDQQHNNQLHR
jgi:hypothetical protein